MYLASMQGDFYRSSPKKPTLRSMIGGVTRNRKRALFAVLALLAVVYLLFDNKGIIKRIRLEMQRKEMIQKVETAEQETIKLQAQKKALEGDRKTVEKLAREKYGMARKGETVYRVKKD